MGREPKLDLFTLIGPASTMEESTHALLGLGRRQLRAEVDAAGHWTAASAAAMPAWAIRLPDDAGARATPLGLALLDGGAPPSSGRSI